MTSLYLLSFILGLAFGSFLNCLVYRLAHRKTLLGRSFCPNCGRQVARYDNVPLVSFIVLGGRCRNCHQKISWQYPLVEVAAALLFLAVVFKYPLSNIQNPASGIQIIRDWLMIFVLLFIFIYDLKYYLIEDIVILPVAAAIFVLNLILKISIFNLLLAAGLAAGFFLLQYFVTRGKGIGLGDFRIGILMGVYFGWPKIAVAVFAAYIIGTVTALLLVALKKKKFASRIPLGPFLAIGSLLAIFYGRKILDFYFYQIRW